MIEDRTKCLVRHVSWFNIGGDERPYLVRRNVSVIITNLVLADGKSNYVRSLFSDAPSPIRLILAAYDYSSKV